GPPWLPRARERRARSRRAGCGTPCRRGMPRDGSRLHPHLLERETKAAQGVRDAALHGAERQAGLLGDLAQAEALEVRELDHLAVLRGEPFECGRDLPPEERALDRLLPHSLVELAGLDGQRRADRTAPLEVDHG